MLKGYNMLSDSKTAFHMLLHIGGLFKRQRILAYTTVIFNLYCIIAII